MARRLRGIAPNGIKYVVHFDRDWREWQVRAYRKNKNGVWKFAEGPTCYCEDKEDATRTFYYLVGHGPAGTHVNPKLRSWGFRIGACVSLKGNAAVTGVVVDPKDWIPREGIDDFNHLKLVCVKWDNGQMKGRVTTIQAGKILRCASNPPKVIYYVQAQGYGPGPVFGTKGETIRAIQAFVREDVRACRRKFGAAFVERRGDTWEVRPLRYSSPHSPMWSRYSVLSVVSNALG